MILKLLSEFHIKESFVFFLSQFSNHTSPLRHRQPLWVYGDVLSRQRIIYYCWKTVYWIAKETTKVQMGYEIIH